MKTIFLSGRLTADPEIREIGEKKAPLAKFSVANNDSSKDTGEFFDINCWDRLAEFAGSYLKKGTRVIIQGTYNNEAYQDADGHKRVHFVINASRIEFAD